MPFTPDVSASVLTCIPSLESPLASSPIPSRMFFPMDCLPKRNCFRTSAAQVLSVMSPSTGIVAAMAIAGCPSKDATIARTQATSTTAITTLAATPRLEWRHQVPLPRARNELRDRSNGSEVCGGDLVILHRHLERRLEKDDHLEHAHRVDDPGGEQAIVVAEREAGAHIQELTLQIVSHLRMTARSYSSGAW